MFDIGFSELVVIGVVALVVIGPERLPKVARTLGHLFGRLQRYVSQVKSDINREIEAADLGKVKSEFESAARSFQADIESHAADAKAGIETAKSSIESAISPQPATPTAPDAAAESRAGSPQLELGIDEPASRERPAP
jgi:sec-independent protein translocase protein TatB